MAAELTREREELVRGVRALVKKYGPGLGPLYYEKTKKWEQSLPAKANTATAAEHKKAE